MTDKARCAACKSSILPLAKLTAVAGLKDFDELIGDASIPVLVDFWAKWCAPCRVVEPELETLARSHSGRLIIAKVDTDALPKVASRYRIRSIPTMILFRAGKEAKRLSGAMHASEILRQLGLDSRPQAASPQP